MKFCKKCLTPTEGQLCRPCQGIVVPRDARNRNGLIRVEHLSPRKEYGIKPSLVTLPRLAWLEREMPR